MSLDLLEEIVDAKRRLPQDAHASSLSAFVAGLALTSQLMTRTLRAALSPDTSRVRELGDECITVAANVLNAAERTLPIDEASRSPLRDARKLGEQLRGAQLDPRWVGSADRRRAIVLWAELLRRELENAASATRRKASQPDLPVSVVRTVGYLAALADWARQG